MEFARPALQSNPMQSHTGGGAQREVNSGTTVSVRLLAVTTGPVSGAGKGTCPFARSCSATSLLSLCQELSLPTASKDGEQRSVQG